MDWGAFLESPETQAALQRLKQTLGKSTDEAAQEMNPLFEHLQRQQDVEQAYKGLPPSANKSAAESADVFQQQLPPPTQPNFTLQGEPYSGNVPALRKQPGLPAAAERDVTPTTSAPDATDGGFGGGNEPPVDQSTWLSEEPEGAGEAETKSPISLGKKAAIGAGALAAGVGGASFLQKDEKQPGDAPPPGTSSPAAQSEIQAEPSDDIGDELDSARDEDFDLKGGRQAAGEQISPQEAQMRQAISNILNFNNPTGGPNALDKVLAQRREELRQANMNEGLARMGAGIARVDPDLSIYENQKKMAGLPLEEYNLRQQNEANDPKSGLSSGMRDYVKTLGVNVPDTASASQIKQVLPYVFKDIEAKQQQAARHSDLQLRQQEMALRYKELQSNKELLRQDKLNKQDQDRVDKLSKNLDNEILRGQTAAGQAARNFQSVENARALLNGTQDPNQLDNRQVFELTRVLDRILSQGNPSMFGSEHLTPDTARGRLAKIMEFWSNQRQGAHAGSFVKTLSDTLNREGMIAQQQLQRHQMELLGGNEDLYQRHPDQIRSILQARGLPSDIFETKAYQHIQRPNFVDNTGGITLPPDAQAKAAAEIQRRRNQGSQGNQ